MFFRGKIIYLLHRDQEDHKVSFFVRYFLNFGFGKWNITNTASTSFKVSSRVRVYLVSQHQLTIISMHDLRVSLLFSLVYGDKR